MYFHNADNTYALCIGKVGKVSDEDAYQPPISGFLYCTFQTVTVKEAAAVIESVMVALTLLAILLHQPNTWVIVGEPAKPLLKLLWAASQVRQCTLLSVVSVVSIV